MLIDDYMKKSWYVLETKGIYRCTSITAVRRTSEWESRPWSRSAGPEVMRPFISKKCFLPLLLPKKLEQTSVRIIPPQIPRNFHIKNKQFSILIDRCSIYRIEDSIKKWSHSLSISIIKANKYHIRYIEN